MTSLGSGLYAVWGKGKPIKDPKNILGGLVMGLGALLMACDQKLHEGIDFKKALNIHYYPTRTYSIILATITSYCVVYNCVKVVERFCG